MPISTDIQVPVIKSSIKNSQLSSRNPHKLIPKIRKAAKSAVFSHNALYETPSFFKNSSKLPAQSVYFVCRSQVRYAMAKPGSPKSHEYSDIISDQSAQCIWPYRTCE